MKDQFGLAEIESYSLVRTAAGHAVFIASAERGKRSNAPYPRCCQCGRVRRDLMDAALSIHGNQISHEAAAGQARA